MLTIGKLAKQAGVHVETIRYYQRIGLIRTPQIVNHYRYYNQKDIETLSFIKNAKDAGLQLKEIKELLQLELNDRHQVRLVIEQRLTKIDQRITELLILKQRLNDWIDSCKQTTSECCPILLDLKQKHLSPNSE